MLCCGVLLVVRSLVFKVWWLWRVICCVLNVLRVVRRVVLCSLFAACCAMLVICRLLFFCCLVCGAACCLLRGTVCCLPCACRCRLTVVECCLLFGVNISCVRYCMLAVVCRSLFATNLLLFVVCCALIAVNGFVFVVCCHVVFRCFLWFATCRS